MTTSHKVGPDPTAECLEGFQLSAQQERAWRVRSEFEPRIQAAFVVHGACNCERVVACARSIAKLHDILRTTYSRWPGMQLPLQVVSEDVCVDFRTEEMQGPAAEALLKCRSEEDWNTPFDLERGPLCIFRAVRVEPAQIHVLVTSSALCGDVRTLWNWVRSIARHQAKDERLSASKQDFVQYAQYAQWQREVLEAASYAPLRRSRPDGQARIATARQCDLPTCHAEAKPRFESCVAAYEPGQRGALQRLAAACANSVEAVLLASWLVCLWRLGGSRQCRLYRMSDGRWCDELQGAFGAFANYQPLNLVANESARFIDLAREVASRLKEVEVADDGVSRLSSAGSEAEGGMALGFEFQEAPQLDAVDEPCVEVRFCRAVHEPFVIQLAALLTTTQCVLRFQYDAAAVEAARIEQLSTCLAAVIASAAQQPQRTLLELEMLSVADRAHQLETLNDTAREYPQERTMAQLLEERAERSGESVAVVCGARELSYRQLHERAQELACELRARGVGAEQVVGILMERSTELVVGVLAVLKAGGGYMPLDVNCPAQRLQRMVQEAKPQLLLVQFGLAQRLPRFEGLAQLYVDENGAAVQEAMPGARMQAAAQGRAGPCNLAYVIYTSGSSGGPKGVMVSQRNLVSSTWARGEYYREAVRAFLLVSPLSFDSSVAGLFWTLLQGGTVVLPQEGQEKDPQELLRLMCERQVSHVLSIGSLYALLLEQAEAERCAGSLRVAIVAGEACAGGWVRRHRQVLPWVALHNEYGPTEATVWSSVQECTAEVAEQRVVPIGRPISNTQLYVLDELQQPVPLGAVGEIYIGGAGVARGYLQRAGATAAAFVPDACSGGSGERLYRTGDLGRYGREGSVEFVARIDEQVKIRGHRVELLEIEAALHEQPEVCAAAVLMRRAASEHAQLVAYIEPCPGASVDTRVVKDRLAKTLPSYMVPTLLHTLEHLPRTSSGKIDRRQLATQAPGPRDDTAILDLLEQVEQLSDVEVHSQLRRSLAPQLRRPTVST